MSDQSKRLEALADKQEIYDVLLRYCRGVDRGDVALIASVYHDDAIDDHGIWRGRGKDFAGFIVSALENTGPCVHMIGNVLIELDGDVAASEAYCLAVHEVEGVHRTVLCRYVDRFERRGGIWKIADRLVVFDLSRTDPVTARYGAELLSGLTFGARGSDDPIYGVLGLRRS